MSDELTISSRFRDYTVFFIESAAESLRTRHPDQTSMFIVDENLLALCPERFDNALKDREVIFVEPTEQHKTLEYCQSIISKLIEKNIRKNCTLVAVGGGIIQDITAFISSVLFRGISWEFYPTTLLAQADSCIGSKASINFGNYKNMLGGFYPPACIFIDVGFLGTLPEEEIRSGIGEMLHYFLIDDSELTRSLMDDYEALLANPLQMKLYMLESLRIKKSMIEIDELDKNQRNIFNYGHTFGHAIETVSDYRVNHGQAVTLGMDIANYISMHLGYVTDQQYASMHTVLWKNIPDFQLSDKMFDRYYSALAKDKKNIGKNLGCILTRGPGKMEKIQIPFDEKLKDLIRSYFKNRVAD